MTKEKAKELSNILLAYSQGKTLQFNNKENALGWEDINTFDLFFIENFIDEYWLLRIKPEPKLVPFTFEDNKLFKGKFVQYVKNDDNKNHYQIVGFGKEHIQLSSGKTHFYETLLKEYVFGDGSPCGKYIK